MESNNPIERTYTPKTDRKKSYDYYLDLLDFKPATKARTDYKRDFLEYHLKPSRRYVSKEDGARFTALVRGFLNKYGPKYFGEGSRRHLSISDPSVGLLYPRDAATEGS